MAKNIPHTPADAAWEITLQFMERRKDELGLTIYQLAKDSNMPESTVHRIMKGERVPSVVSYLQLLKGLRLTQKLLKK